MNKILKFSFVFPIATLLCLSGNHALASDEEKQIPSLGAGGIAQPPNTKSKQKSKTAQLKATSTVDDGKDTLSGATAEPLVDEKDAPSGATSEPLINVSLTEDSSGTSATATQSQGKDDTTPTYQSFTDIIPETFIEQLGLSESHDTTVQICHVLGIDASDFNEIYTEYTSRTSNLSEMILSISVNPRRFFNHEYMADIYDTLMVKFLSIIDDTVCTQRLSAIAKLFSDKITNLTSTSPKKKTVLKFAQSLDDSLSMANENTITELKTRFKEMLCHIAFTRTYIREANNSIVALKEQKQRASKDSLPKAELIEKSRAAIESATKGISDFRRDILKAETLLRSLYFKPTRTGISAVSVLAKSRAVRIFKDTRSEAEVMRELLTGETNLSDYEIVCADMASTDTEEENQIRGWKKTYIEHMLRPSIALEEAKLPKEGRIVYHVTAPKAEAKEPAKAAIDTETSDGDIKSDGSKALDTTSSTAASTVIAATRDNSEV